MRISTAWRGSQDSANEEFEKEEILAEAHLLASPGAKMHQFKEERCKTAPQSYFSLRFFLVIPR
jgi:hypothetical protein